MHRKSFTVTALALWLATSMNAQAVIGTDWDIAKRLIHAAYFSDSCRQQAEALGITGTSDANALFAAFVRFARPVDTRSGVPDAQRDECGAPAVLLINVLRRNGVNAEIVFASMSSASAADAAFAKIDRVLVFVPELDRYLNPSASVVKQTVLNQIIRETARRVHVLGPIAGDGQGACSNICIRDYSPSGETTIRIKTEVIRSR